jgi:glycosyltransferase involved in cell wall biosynthesis
MQEHKITFIIATADRKEKLFNLLRSLQRQNINSLQVIIVDAGQTNIKEILTKFKELTINYIKVEKPSLTVQRNIGIEALDDKITLVGFLDDDMELEDNSLENMIEFWNKAPLDIGGACFNVITNKRPRFAWIKAIFATGKKQRGVVLSSGFATEVCPVDTDISTQWLLGGATIWRRKVLNEFKFDEWFEGYGLHEDLDFSYRVGKRYKLVVVANAKIRHLQSPISKKNNFEFGKMEVLGHYRIVIKHPELSKALFLWACFGQFLENIYLAIAKRKKEYLTRALGNFSGILQVRKAHTRDKKRILVVGYKAPPYGGMETITEMIFNSAYLNKEFNLIKMILQTRSSSRNRGKFGLKNIILTINNLIRYVCLIIQHRPDMIYTHLAQNRIGFLRDSLFILISWLFRAKNCIHFHGSAFRYFYNSQPHILKAYIRFVLKRINSLIVLGIELKKQFYGLVNKNKIIHFYNAVRAENYPYESKNRHFRDKLRVTFIGYISKAKGAIDVVKAASLILSQNENGVFFDLYGPIIDIERNITFIDEPNYALLKINKIINQNGLKDLIKVHPALDKDSQREVLANTDIFVFPSYSEGCALVILEAMAAGLPIIMSRVGSLPEVLKEGINCFFVEPGDYVDLAKKISILLKSEELRLKMGRDNYSFVRERFNPENFERNLAKVWAR